MDDMGKVVLKINKLLDERHFLKSKFARDAKIQYRQATSYYNGDMKKVDLDILARICHLLNCNISDILEYIQ